MSHDHVVGRRYLPLSIWVRYLPKSTRVSKIENLHVSL